MKKDAEKSKDYRKVNLSTDPSDPDPFMRWEMADVIKSANEESSLVDVRFRLGFETSQIIKQPYIPFHTHRTYRYRTVLIRKPTFRTSKRARSSSKKEELVTRRESLGLIGISSSRCARIMISLFVVAQ